MIQCERCKLNFQLGLEIAYIDNIQTLILSCLERFDEVLLPNISTFFNPTPSLQITMEKWFSQVCFASKKEVNNLNKLARSKKKIWLGCMSFSSALTFSL